MSSGAPIVDADQAIKTRRSTCAVALRWVQILSILPMLDRAIDALKSDEAKALREFSDPTSLLLALRSRIVGHWPM